MHIAHALRQTILKSKRHLDMHAIDFQDDYDAFMQLGAPAAAQPHEIFRVGVKPPGVSIFNCWHYFGWHKVSPSDPVAGTNSAWYLEFDAPRM